MQRLIEFIRPGARVFIPGSTAEPRTLVSALGDAIANLYGVHFTTSFIPGVNRAFPSSFGENCRETCFFHRPGSETISSIDVIPESYWGLASYLDQQRFDLALIAVSPPDEKGSCSLGLSPEFFPIVRRRADKIMAVINPRIPQLPNAPRIPISELDFHEESEFAPVEYSAGKIDAVSQAISANIAELVDEGSTLQVGLGKVPNGFLGELSNHRGLKFHSGMLSDGFMQLAEAGSLDMDYRHTSCCLLGSGDFYRAAADMPFVYPQGVDFTHDPKVLGSLDRFVAVNSALEVDLWGQANLEFRGGQAISGVGGAPDFARAARNSATGKSVIALPATAGKGSASRIVTHLDGRLPCSIPRYDIDFVVTEYGVARLSGKSADARAQALIQIAAPQFRSQLQSDWESVRASKPRL